MGTQAAVHSIEALKGLRTALALFAEDSLSALAAVDMELRRVGHWLEYDRPTYWQGQIKRRREEVAQAKAEVFRRKLAKTPEYTPAMTEQKEILRKAEAGLLDAEKRLALVKKWRPAFQQAVLEYHASVRRITDLSSGEVPRALAALERMVDALEAYLRVAPPSAGGFSPTADAGLLPLEAIADEVLGREPEPDPGAGTDAGAAGGPEAEG
jgi:hypothetical protein